MGDWMVLIGVFAVFIPALMLPGPDFVAVVRASMAHGPSAGLLTTLGVSTCLCLYATLSIIGLSAILVEYQWLAWVIRLLGGGYLVYLGVNLLRSQPAPIDASGSGHLNPHRAFFFGFLVTLTNPKAIVLFTSVFATAITASTTAFMMGVMIGLVTLASLIWYSVVSLFMSSAPVMRRFQNAKHWIERAAGICFVGLGGKLLTDARTPLPG